MIVVASRTCGLLFSNYFSLQYLRRENAYTMPAATRAMEPHGARACACIARAGEHCLVQHTV